MENLLYLQINFKRRVESTNKLLINQKILPQIRQQLEQKEQIFQVLLRRVHQHQNRCVSVKMKEERQHVLDEGFLLEEQYTVSRQCPISNRMFMNKQSRLTKAKKNVGVGTDVIDDWFLVSDSTNSARQTWRRYSLRCSTKTTRNQRKKSI